LANDRARARKYQNPAGRGAALSARFLVQPEQSFKINKKEIKYALSGLVAHSLNSLLAILEVTAIRSLLCRK
jgi:hypothetical protein